MKKIIIFFFVFFSAANLHAQDSVADSLKRLLQNEKTDTGRIKLLINLGNGFGFGSTLTKDSSLSYLQQALELSKKINYIKGIISSQSAMTYTLDFTGNYPEALDLGLRNLKLAKQVKDSNEMFWQTRAIAWIYRNIGDNKAALTYANQLAELARLGTFREPAIMERLNIIVNQNLGLLYFGLSQMDSCLYYLRLNYASTPSDKEGEMHSLATYYLGDTYAKLRINDSAFFFYRQSVPFSVRAGRPDYAGRAQLGMAFLFSKAGEYDSALFYARQSLQTIKNTFADDVVMGADSLLSTLYQGSHQYDSAYKHLQSFVMLKDSLNNQSKITLAQNLSFTEALHRNQLEQEKKETQQKYQARLQVYSFAGILFIFLIVAFLLSRNNRNIQKANLLLNKQKAEIEDQKKNVEDTLSELKSTQAQLIQSEKMASLGELTAGIAHEIQNPLNFVNNFSDINQELIGELQEDLKSGNVDDATAISNDIKSNSEKINHHGKRADAIVKGMLQHSRSSSGVKEPTDINALCDEYLRLAYHGLRAKDKSFNATIETNFDEGIGKINVVPQDIGRVLLNIINNAFFAVNERGKNLQGFQNLEGLQQGYVPSVTLVTRKDESNITISIKDNGSGIPKKIKDKIFQPFFTTKPTGSGTGLGLSLAYDIVKAHGGEMRVESLSAEAAAQAGAGGETSLPDPVRQGTEFKVILPI